MCGVLFAAQALLYLHVCFVCVRGCPNVVEFLDAFRIPSGGFAIVFPLVEHDDFLAIVQRCTMQDIRYYMRALLQALAHVHAKVRDAWLLSWPAGVYFAVCVCCRASFTAMLSLAIFCTT